MALNPGNILKERKRKDHIVFFIHPTLSKLMQQNYVHQPKKIFHQKQNSQNLKEESYQHIHNDKAAYKI